MLKKVFFLLVLTTVFLSVHAQNNPLWLRYPAISPDGKYVVFEYKGDLWKVSTQGGEAIPLTIHKAYEFRPVWSPDGKYIAFASDRNGNFDVYLMPAKGGKAKRLTYFSGNEIPYEFTVDSKSILFATTLQKPVNSLVFPTRWLTELYKINTDGSGFTQVLSTPAELVSFNKQGDKFVYQDKKGVEDYWRKHHTSSVTRDIWIYDYNTKTHKKLTTFIGEDRNPVYSPDNKYVYFLTEQFNSNLNIAKFPIDNPADIKQITNYENHPVRFLTISDNGTLCYSWNGEIYTLKEGSSPVKLNVSINYDGIDPDVDYKVYSSGADEMSVSPDGKYVAFIVRGDVYVTSVDNPDTRQITNTPEQERSVSFSPDGKSLVYAGERNGSWNIYVSKIADKDQQSFLLAEKITEEPIIANQNEEEFQPKFSPDGKEIAFLANRTTLKVINLKTKQVRTVLDGKYNYSYSDGDQWYDWSPDGKWFLVNYTPYILFSSEVGLVDASGNGKIINLTQSGYQDNTPKWMMNGKMMIWFSDRNGYRSHGSWGSEFDVYGMFFTQEAFDVFNMSKTEYEAWKKQQEEKNKDKNDKDKDKKGKKKDEKNNETKKTEPVKIDFNYLEDRTVRLTINSAKISDAVITEDGEKLFYLAKFEKGYDLWVHNLRKNETKLVLKMQGYAGDLTLDKDGKNLFVFADGNIYKIDANSFEKKTVSFKAEKNIDYYAEKAYLFEHAWRQMYEKFYNPDMHGVDWSFYKKEYSKFLPYINNNYDFAEMMSEMLGELNASHTGSGYRPKFKNADRTASLGIIFDFDYTGKGVKVAEIIEKSPFINAKSKIKPGNIIEKINDNSVTDLQTYFKLLNHKSGKQVFVQIFDPKSGKRWTEKVKPISLAKENNLLYQRWVKREREITHKLSNNKVGYVHVKGMNSQSFREVFSEALGKEIDKKAIIIDTRFNTGGWLHDDLATLFSGKKYVEYWPRGQYFGYDPMSKWTGKSIVLMNEGNYSDAHGFPYAYKTLEIGKLVGMPVPGTMTAVWWETLMDNTLYFGIPQVGTKDLKGKYLENQQLEPDIKVWNDYEKIINGQDQQLEAAVKELLKEIAQ